MSMWTRCLGAGLLWGILAGPLSGEQGSDDAIQLARAGSRLTDEQARALEATLKSQPDDLAARGQLLGYYTLQAFRSPEASRAKQGHVLWLVQHHPEAEIAGSPDAELHSGIDGEAYYKAKSLWLDQAKAHAKEACVLGHAARYVQLEDSAAAEGLLKQAQDLEPSSSRWPLDLGHLYMRRLTRVEGNENRTVAAKALQCFERALEITDSRDPVLGEAARAALEAGDTEKARRYALDLLDAPTEGWNYGNAIHHGNLVLGRLALQSGNVPEARQYLLKAGQTPGSPQLNSFGPNMLLAKELLAKGERDVVLEYLQLCSRFWKMDRDRLKNWAATIRGGGTPDFQGSLRY